jgi:hypothetical protein
LGAASSRFCISQAASELINDHFIWLCQVTNHIGVLRFTNPSIFAGSTIKQSAIDLTVSASTKMGIQGDQGVMSLSHSLGVSVKDSDGRKLRKVDLVSALKSCFKAMHHDKKSNYQDSSCFQALKQKLVLERNTRAASSPVLPVVSGQQKNTRFRKKVPTPESVVNVSIKNCGYFIDTYPVLRCHYDNKSNTKMNEAALKVHVTMQKHVAWAERRGEEHYWQSRPEEVAQECHTTASRTIVLAAEGVVF